MKNKRFIKIFIYIALRWWKDRKKKTISDPENKTD